MVYKDGIFNVMGNTISDAYKTTPTTCKQIEASKSVVSYLSLDVACVLGLSISP